MDDFPERLSDSAGGLGNMPELTLLLEDDEVIKKFSVSLTGINWIASVWCAEVKIQELGGIGIVDVTIMQYSIHGPVSMQFFKSVVTSSAM